MGVEPMASSPQNTTAPAGLLVTRAVQSRAAGAPCSAAGADAGDGSAAPGDATTAGAAAGGAGAFFEAGLSAIPNSTPASTHAAYGPQRRAMRSARSRRF